jgi:superfamily I DNA/RNA helicase
MKALAKYTPEKIIILSHTNIAANEIRDAIFDLKNLKNEEGNYTFPQLRGITKKAMKYRVCTIHTYCKSRLLKKEVFKLHNHKELINKDSRFNLHREDDIKRKHRFYKYLSDADGHGETLDKYWIKCDQKSFEPYSLKLIKELLPLYEKYKKDKTLCDFSDMVNNFTRQTYNEKTKQWEDDVKDPDIDMLIIDECQDCNVPQRKAIDKMARNVKEGHYYLVGDADQTLFEYSGSDAKYFHNLAANPYDELKNGNRCGEAINTYCKSIIMDVWDHYKSHRVWTPAKYKKGPNEGEVIKGKGYYLPDLKPSRS